MRRLRQPSQPAIGWRPPSFAPTEQQQPVLLPSQLLKLASSTFAEFPMQKEQHSFAVAANLAAILEEMDHTVGASGKIIVIALL